jgi:hypothetical protein
MIASPLSAIMPRMQIQEQERPMDDRISDLAGARRPPHHRRVGATGLTADVIRFIPRPKVGRGPTDFPTIAFRTAGAATECPDAVRREHVQSKDDGLT